ncbi:MULTISPECIES: extracellular solute-binding protein [Streptomyces]|uniref:Extracellular solute-binding lipoprotein n=1 Tax=Streptomyces albus (strain ATCC 21838 / DSM 41398 / FERM P-419 / JCM 4703 / NBRC 107858) TaxID=1081613 RepID=A0A0B5ESH9_STRA4|nr:extracellular solute-binding protein [Streptomyces sp. SCSIO ZS0520]AJE82225.1 extracellular solute-binding lipoprotein [Streptomyces albus]AOU76542.1 extracellular solute-binding lipoprotein [Streptomyces albus]AYN32325.1 sugar ABC transporter substrate-binding protein [Streptomyces albus]
MRPTAPVLLSLVVAAATLTACGGGSGSDPDTVKVAYNRSTDNKTRYKDEYLADMKKQFEKEHPGKKVELVPIQAPDNDYATKAQQMMRSPRTAPDLVYEDTFRINADIKAGYLRPLDKELTGWPEWERFADSAKAAAKAEDGKTYGIPVGTDTRGLWFNKKIFAKAGLPEDWKPKNWNEILTAARTVKKKVPGVTPLNVYTGKAPGETAVMQGFEMLLYGTGKDPLYDPAAKKWVTGGKGFQDALGFIDTVYREKLGPDVSDALDANVATSVGTQWFPEGKLAIGLDGSWLGQNWINKGPREWPSWSKDLGQAPMPTQHGQAPGAVSMSGGWAWSIPRKAGNPELAFEFVKTLQKKENAVRWDVADAQIAVREDVAADPKYLNSMPGIKFFTSLVDRTHYRPALPVYPQVSTAIGEAMEAVTTGDASPAGAAKEYDGGLGDLVGGAVVNR